MKTPPGGQGYGAAIGAEYTAPTELKVVFMNGVLQIWRSAGAGKWRCWRDGLARPHPGLLPRGEGETSAVDLIHG